MLKLDFKDTAWWFWAATTAALTLGASGDPRGFPLSLAVTVVHMLHCLIRYRSISRFPVQVRAAVLVSMVVGLWPPMVFIYYMLTAGGWARVLFGYCLMARLVSLLPWNRSEPLSADKLKTTFLTPPTRGNVLQGFDEVAAAVAET